MPADIPKGIHNEWVEKHTEENRLMHIKADKKIHTNFSSFLQVLLGRKRGGGMAGEAEKISPYEWLGLSFILNEGF